MTRAGDQVQNPRCDGGTDDILAAAEDFCVSRHRRASNRRRTRRPYGVLWNGPCDCLLPDTRVERQAIRLPILLNDGPQNHERRVNSVRRDAF